jgi:hypothetical protein
MSKSPAKAAAEHAAELNAAQHESDLNATIEHLRAQVAEHRATIQRYQKSRGGLIEVAREICTAVKALEPPKFVPYKPGDPSRSEVAVVANISDLHIGEIIRPVETGGFGAFNYEIAKARMATYRDNLLSWTALNRRAYNIPDLHVFAIGDYVSGDIHAELLKTNEFPLPGQTARAGELIAAFVRDVAARFRKVYFHGVGADNHGRLQPKPQAKQKAANNMSYLVHALVEAYSSKIPNVAVTQYEDMKPVIEVANHRFLVEHGDNYKAQFNIAYYGIERGRGREATRRMLTGDKFHYMNLGHWHVPGVISGNVIMNGSLSGSTEYDHAAGRHAAPSQISYLVHPRWGMYNWVAWKFAVESEETDARRK